MWADEVKSYNILWDGFSVMESNLVNVHLLCRAVFYMHAISQ